MRKLILGGAAVLALASGAFVGQANAQTGCTWTGYAWSCPQPYYAAPGTYAPYGYPSTGSNPEITGYKPPWLPSYPGPKPSGGAGR
ncbi:MAG: hypothetical protein JO001_23640 [Alphaproteobacteria bacterium]|nr:hypothetical protein [Alphaproteobacteria bacterium]